MNNTLIIFDGCFKNALNNLNIRDSRGGWAIYFGAACAIVLQNTTLVGLSNNLFRRLDGKCNISITNNEFNYIADNVIGIVGKVNDFNGFINNSQSKLTDITVVLIQYMKFDYINHNQVFISSSYSASCICDFVYLPMCLIKLKRKFIQPATILTRYTL